jgi:thiamine-monophosphate kinase
MHESELLKHIYARASAAPRVPGLDVGPGDDCCILRFGGERLLLSTDQLIEGRHFDHTASTDQIARKAIARAVSDIAAMGGEPIATLAASCLPPDYPHAKDLFDRVHHWGQYFAAPVVGGDIATSEGPAVLTITVIGRVREGGKPILRSDAKPGDSLYVTGKLGGSLASGRHLSFDPRIAECAELVCSLGPNLHAMIDLSDGLGCDGARLAEASSVALLLDAPALPLHDGVVSWREAVSDGEDYELLFAVESAADVPAKCAATGTPFTRIGRVDPGSGCKILLKDNTVVDIAQMGWDHKSTGGEA